MSINLDNLNFIATIPLTWVVVAIGVWLIIKLVLGKQR